MYTCVDHSSPTSGTRAMQRDCVGCDVFYVDCQLVPHNVIDKQTKRDPARQTGPLMQKEAQDTNSSAQPSPRPARR